MLTLYIKLKKIFISKRKGDGKEIKIALSPTITTFALLLEPPGPHENHLGIIHVGHRAVLWK